MKRDAQSSRSTKFITRNSLSFDTVMEYVSNLCEVMFKIKDYSYKPYKGNMALWITVGMDKYILYLDCKYVELKVIKNDNLDKVFYGDTCWFQSLKWVEQKSAKSLA